jgi:hypothetical protein
MYCNSIKGRLSRLSMVGGYYYIFGVTNHWVEKYLVAYFIASWIVTNIYRINLLLAAR